jgi:UPF0042 nucleotide-binding protein
MKLQIVSGLSGSGKSIALNALEDEGYYCIDNLPLGLLTALFMQIINSPEEYSGKAAVGIDARTPAEDLEAFPVILEKLERMGVSCEIIFLEADVNILLKRFSETRRKHPLTRPDVSLTEAIQHERAMLEPIMARANLYLDTSDTNVHQLRKRIQQVAGNEGETLSLQFQSFGYKHGVPVDVDFVFDLRCLPNPHWEPKLRNQTGMDRDVAEFLDQQVLVSEMFESISKLLEKWLPYFIAEKRRYMTIAIGCTGGQHRSVYMVQRLADYFSQTYSNILMRHRELL